MSAPVQVPTSDVFDYTGTIVTYTVPVSGIYDITAIGAGGGGSPFAAGGAGALITADFSLTAGTELEILVGGAGAASDVGDGGGGGGGSFVIDAGAPTVIRNGGVAEPAAFALVVAGGGGGAGGGPGGPNSDGLPASTKTGGTSGEGDLGGAGGNGGSGSGGSGGTGGGFSLGGTPDPGGGGGGGGYTSSGGGAYRSDTSGGAGGASFAAGGANSFAGGFGGGGQGGSEQVTTQSDTITIAPGVTITEPIVVPGDGGGGGGYSGGGGGGTDEITNVGTDTDSGPSSDAGAGGGGGGSYIDTAAEIVVVRGGGGGGILNAAVPAIGLTPVPTDGSPGTDGEVSIALLCFLAGTAIATPSGAVAVQALRVGDAVRTAEGRAAAVRWIGRWSVDAASPLDRDLHYPVRVCRDAVAPGVPARDLLVTGDHALWIDGRLIPARLLVNGVSIVAERAMAEFMYFHLELDRHDLLLAEGLACESYLDTGNRHMFLPDMIAPATRGDAVSAYAAHGIAPLALAAELVEPVWRRLAARAGVAAPACVAAPGEGAVHLLAGGARLRPLCAASGRLLFALPAGVSEAVIASDTMRPSERQPWLDDRRRLGVAVRRIRVQAGGESRDIALDAPALAHGWHGVERTRAAAVRWTAGEAALRLPAGAQLLELTVARRPGSGGYLPV